MSRQKGPEKSRFTLWIPDVLMKDVEAIRKRMGKESSAEVVRDAILVYAELLRARDAGVELFFEDVRKGERGRVWVLPGQAPASARRR